MRDDKLDALGDKVDISLANAVKRAVSLKACMDRTCTPDRDREAAIEVSYRTDMAALFARKRAGSLTADAHKAAAQNLEKRRASSQAAAKYVACALQRCDDAVRDLLKASSVRTQDRLSLLRASRSVHTADAIALLKRTRALIQKRTYSKADLPTLYTALVMDPY